MKKGNYFTIALVLIIVYFAVMMLKPYITVAMTAALLAFIFYPLYRLVKKLFRNEGFSAFVTSLLVVILVTIPLVLLLVSMQKEAVSTYEWARQNIETGQGTAKHFSELINKYDLQKYVNLGEVISKASNAIIGWVTGFLLGIPKRLLEAFILIFLMYYFFKDGIKFMDEIEKATGVSKGSREELANRLHSVARGVVFGSVVVALIQGALGAIGFWLLGLSAPLLWGMVMALLALIPYTGTGLVWGPASIYLFVEGFPAGTWYKGIILLVYGIVIVSFSDNFIRAKIIGSTAKVHPAVVLLGVIGGLPVFGFVGIFLGPIVLALLITVVSIYTKEQKNEA